ncbi:hypothetical protein E4U15_007590 [Claviceps sp. LM218 group G6]|nr:hypothetical protein E4U15_007590 [Claviceps sp. LM218 group G6]
MASGLGLSLCSSLTYFEQLSYLADGRPLFMHAKAPPAFVLERLVIPARSGHAVREDRRATILSAEGVETRHEESFHHFLLEYKGNTITFMPDCSWNESLVP